MTDIEQSIASFVAESNRIEGIDETTPAHIAAHVAFIIAEPTIQSLCDLVTVLQPDAIFRDSPRISGVRVGGHIAPPSGEAIRTELESILGINCPWMQHIAYETLHPFTDGNGRSGRALWLRRHITKGVWDRWAVRRGFLHSWYYLTLQNVREL